MMFKTVTYGYPSSTTAAKYGLAKVGVWVVESLHGKRRIFPGDVSRDVVFDCADSLPGEYRDGVSLRRTQLEQDAAIKRHLIAIGMYFGSPK